MNPVGVCNLALAEVGSRIFITSFSDNSPQAQVANLFYVPKVTAYIRGAPWDFARAQVTLAVWKAAVINGVASSDPPPQPWLYSYLYPTDCLDARFVIPTVAVADAGTPLTTSPGPFLWGGSTYTASNFVVATDLDANNNPIKVILSNLPQAQLIYTRDLSGVPDMWDALFLSGVTAFLAAYFINALARNAAQYGAQVAAAKAALDQARMANNNEGLGDIDHFPDWLQARMVGGRNWNFNNGGPGLYGGWDAVGFPDLSY